VDLQCTPFGREVLAVLAVEHVVEALVVELLVDGEVVPLLGGVEVVLQGLGRPDEGGDGVGVRVGIEVGVREHVGDRPERVRERVAVLTLSLEGLGEDAPGVVEERFDGRDHLGVAVVSPPGVPDRRLGLTDEVGGVLDVGAALRFEVVPQTRQPRFDIIAGVVFVVVLVRYWQVGRFEVALDVVQFGLDVVEVGLGLGRFELGFGGCQSFLERRGRTGFGFGVVGAGVALGVGVRGVLVAVGHARWWVCPG